MEKWQGRGCREKVDAQVGGGDQRDSQFFLVLLYLQVSGGCAKASGTKGTLTVLLISDEAHQGSLDQLPNCLGEETCCVHRWFCCRC